MILGCFPYTFPVLFKSKDINMFFTISFPLFRKYRALLFFYNYLFYMDNGACLYNAFINLSYDTQFRNHGNQDVVSYWKMQTVLVLQFTFCRVPGQLHVHTQTKAVFLKLSFPELDILFHCSDPANPDIAQFYQLQFSLKHSITMPSKVSWEDWPLNRCAVKRKPILSNENKKFFTL
jgi:hypothetical protein